MTAGTIVTTPEGEQIVLDEVGQDVLLDDDCVRVWNIALTPEQTQGWHHHHNPYVVLSVRGSQGRVDNLDGSPPRFITEYRGGAVHRPVTPVHRLTNVGENFYCCRLVELKHLGEYLPEPFDIGAGARSIEGEPIAPPLADGRQPVIDHPHVRVWTLTLDPRASVVLELADLHHVVAALDQATIDADATGGVSGHPGGPLQLANDGDLPASWFVVELTYLDDLDATLAGGAV